MTQKSIDPQLFNLIQCEQQRQKEQLQMIPSENYVSAEVLDAVGSVLMNKYSEGQVGKRYYQGNQFIDQIENLVKQRALKAFKLDTGEWEVNVQAITGSIANLAVLSALINPGDKVLSMSLYNGGHLSHVWELPDGKKVSFSSKIYNPSYYQVDPKTGVLNYDEIENQTLNEKSQIIISGSTAYPREIDHQRMRKIADQVNAYYLADIAHEAGLIIAGVNKSPFPYADVVTMTTRKTLRGPIGALIFSRKDLIEKINYAVFPGLQGGPQNHSIAGIGVALQEALQPEFKQYAVQTIKNVQVLAQKLIEYDFNVCSGGTDNHLILIDLRNKDITGKDAALVLEKANIIVNKNTVPGETSKAWNPSGIRLGTPALTSRGMKEAEMEKIADWINQIIENHENQEIISKIADKVTEFALKFPAPGITTP